MAKRRRRRRRNPSRRRRAHRRVRRNPISFLLKNWFWLALAGGAFFAYKKGLLGGGKSPVAQIADQAAQQTATSDYFTY